MIQDVEEFAPELQPEPLVELGGLGNRCIPLCETWSSASIAPNITELVSRGCAKGETVELVSGHVEICRANRCAGDKIRTELINTQKRRVKCDREWQTAACLQQGADLPPFR